MPEDSSSIEALLNKIKRLLCKVDSSGVTFHHIFQERERNQYKMFKQFLLNIEIWGSYCNLPLENHGIYNIRNARRMSEFQITDILEALNQLIKETKAQHFPIQKLLLEKTGVLCYFLVKVAKHIQSKLDDESANLLGGRDDDPQSENDSLVSKGNTKATFEDDESVSFLDISKVNDENIGMFFPIRCGHNGCFNHMEMELYRSHLKQVFEHLRNEE